jgi:hypothetical protein
MRRVALSLALAALLLACATLKTPEQVRIEGLARECLTQRDRDTIESVEVDPFGRVMAYGRQTPRWNQETEALGDCLEAKGVELRGRMRAPVLK